MSSTFFFVYIMLAELLLRYCNNLSRAIKISSMPAVETHSLSELCMKAFQTMRNDRDFDLFWQLVHCTKEQLDVNEPVLHRSSK